MEWTVARMQRSEIRGYARPKAPDSISFHPGSANLLHHIRFNRTLPVRGWPPAGLGQRNATKARQTARIDTRPTHPPSQPMLSYRHAFHAGNHADVLKHCLLIACLRYLNSKDKPWWYVDTHAGAGLYDLNADFARKNAEFEAGIGRLWNRNDLPALVADYVGLVRDLNPDNRLRLYPGSPWLASRIMRADDQLRLFELHSTDAQMLRHVFTEVSHHVKAEATDGFLNLKAVLPPQPRRGLVLIDPSYEIKDDYRRVIAAVKEGLERFPSGTYAIWYPMLQRPEAKQMPDKLKRLPVKSWLHAALTVQAPAPDGFGMHGSGLFIVNPPWQLATQLRDTLPWLTAALAVDAGASFTLEAQSD
jgi:23S rRNA (adenine2030-N6)-methyltransferase